MENVITNMTAETLYEVPLLLEEEGLCRSVCRHFGITASPDHSEWRRMVEKIKGANKKVKIALVGKYVELHDAYLSVAEALHHAGWESDAVVEIGWIQSENLTAENAAGLLSPYDGILVPGASATGASRGRSRRSATRGKTMFLFSASVSVCSLRSLNSRGTFSA